MTRNGMSAAHNGAADRAPGEKSVDEKEVEAEAERARRHALAELLQHFPVLMGVEPVADGHEEPDWEAVRDALREMTPDELREALTGIPSASGSHTAATADGLVVLVHPGDDDGTVEADRRGDDLVLDHPGDWSDCSGEVTEGDDTGNQPDEPLLASAD